MGDEALEEKATVYVMKIQRGCLQLLAISKDVCLSPRLSPPYHPER